MASIYDLSWGETSFLAKLQLFFKSRKQEKMKMRSSDRQTQARGYSALSSTYYSIVGTALAQFRVFFQPKWFTLAQVLAWCLTWLPLGALCYWRMLSLSNQIVKLVGYDGMSPDQCDIRQSILRRRGRYKEAEKCIHAALAKHPKKVHTRGLLYVGLAEIYFYHSPFKAAIEVLNALAAAEGAEQQGESRQAARIYRHCAKLQDALEKRGCVQPTNYGEKLRCKAQTLAQAAGARDQLLKL